jgi:hypothetical protein
MRSGKDLKSKCPLVNAKSMRRRLAAGVLAPAERGVITATAAVSANLGAG